MNDSDLQDVAGIVEDALDAETEMGYSSGITGAGAFGCDYGDYRIEGELGYQSGNVEGISIDFSNVVDIHSDLIIGYGPEQQPIYLGDVWDGKESASLEDNIYTIALMVNGYYDIVFGGVELSPYVGVGVAQVTFRDIKAAGGLVPEGRERIIGTCSMS